MQSIYLLFAIILLFALLCFIIGYCTMRFVIYPKRISYEEAEQIEKSKNFWGDFDSYEKEEWNINSFDNYLLHGMLLKNHSKKFVIITHGYTYNMLGSIKYANIFYKLGYNVYLYDLRHFGKNTPCYCSMGHVEPKDILAIQQALYQRFGNDISIGMHGESLGCASSLLALSYSQKFDFLVADCGFSDLKMLLQDQAKKMFHMPGWILWFTDFWLKLLHGYRFSQIHPIAFLSKNKVPILFFHGADDDFISPVHTQYSYDATQAPKQIFFIPGAQHAQSYETDPLGYEDKIASFLNQLPKQN